MKRKTTRHPAKKTRWEIIGPVGIVAIMILAFGVAFVGPNAMAAKSASGFAQNAAIGNEFEIESSRLALQKSQNPDVTTFAQRMIDDHTKAGQDLENAISTQQNSDVPMPDKTLDHKHQHMLDKLNQASASDFDKLYVKDQVAAHDETVSLFKDYANHGDNPALKNFASQTLPTLQDHQHDIHQIKSSM